MVALAVDMDAATGRTGVDLDLIARLAGCHRSSVGRSIRTAVALGELEPHPSGTGWRFTLPQLVDVDRCRPALVPYRWGTGTPPEPAA